jgi:hypothetical protein
MRALLPVALLVISGCGASKLTFISVPAGQRPVEVFPPSGFLAGADGTVQNADVIKSQTSTVTFTLMRKSP